MPLARDPNATIEYVLKCDRALPEEQQSRFMIGTLDPFTAASIRDRLAGYSLSNKGENNELATVSLKKNQLDYETVQLGLKGWKQFSYRNGQGQPQDAAFTLSAQDFKGIGSKNAVSKESMRFFTSPEWITELAEAIRGENILTEGEAKN